MLLEETFMRSCMAKSPEGDIIILKYTFVNDSTCAILDTNPSLNASIPYYFVDLY